MSPELQLLTGRITDAEYHGTIDAESRGLRFPVARPGWARRFYRITEALVALVIFLLLVAALSGDILLAFASMDRLP
jgi:hypothetical protein